MVHTRRLIDDALDVILADPLEPWAQAAPVIAETLRIAIGNIPPAEAEENYYAALDKISKAA